jgi:hypothetical protein
VQGAAAVLWVCLAAANSHAQAAAEAAAATAASAGMMTGVVAKAPKVPAATLSGSTLPAPAASTPPAPVPMGVREGPAVEEANRKALEEHAGKDAAKLLLRSEPTQALVYVDGKSVGLTPLLLIVPPGKFQVEMRGPHQEFGSGAVVLAPNETRQYLVPLTPRFTTNVTARPSAAGSITVNFGKASNPNNAPPSGGSQGSAAPAAQLASPAPSGPPPEEANRKLFEDQAGNDAGKLALKSDPPEAQVYIDGIYVGRAPVEIHLAPGKYQVIMRGKDGQSGERFIGLLPKETQQVTLPLNMLYPDQVSVHWPQGSSESH